MSATNIPMLDPRRAGDELDAALRAAFERVLRSGRYIHGPEVEAFEAACAEYLGCAHAVALSSGTDALLVALMALSVGRGDEVICPTYSFFATAGAIARLGATPVFVDVCPRSFNLRAADVAEARTPRTKAIVPVHLFGQCAAMDRIKEAAPDLPLIEDAAQAFGAKLLGRAAGAWGLAGCFSFFPSKHLGALGDAGLLTTDDGDFAARVRRLRAHGAEPKYVHHVVGGNFRMDALQAAFLRAKLPRLPAAIARRRAHAAAYDAAFAHRADLSPPHVCRADAPHTYHQYVVQLRSRSARDHVQQRLAAAGIASAIYYPIPLHRQACFAHLPARTLPVAEALARDTLALPIFPELRESERARVIATLLGALDERDCG